MCERCYQKHTGGIDPVVTEEMRVALALVKEIYARPWGDTGGPLHVIVDDMNVMDWLFAADKHVDFTYYKDLGPADRDLCIRTFEALRNLTEAQRAWCTRWWFLVEEEAARE